MINAMTALNMTEEAIKFKENIWNVIEKKIKKAASAGQRICEYEVYPDSPVSWNKIVSKLEELGYKVEVDYCNEAELEFEAEYCHNLIITW